MTQDEGRPPRRRRRASAPAGPPQPAASTPATAAAKSRDQPKTRGQARRRDNGERGLRDLAGAGSTQVSVSRALRARDVNRPSEQDLADAEAELHVVRRNWRPES